LVIWSLMAAWPAIEMSLSVVASALPNVAELALQIPEIVATWVKWLRRAILF
jgi:hypothetical protein